MQEVRCGNCRRKLAMADFVRLEIKCSRCGILNLMRAESPTPERHRASSTEVKHDDDKESTGRSINPSSHAHGPLGRRKTSAGAADPAAVP
ncbi:MAG: Com family DNA-binding transcriptional regulator [Rhodoferax sp.]